MSICFAVFFGECALPDVAHVFAVGFEVVSPGVAHAVQAAACGKFPFGFCGQAFSGPVAVGDGVVPRDVDRGVVPAVVYICSGSFGAVPAGAVNSQPPGGIDDGLRDVRGGVGGYKEVEDKGPAKAFGFGFVRGCADEFGKVGVGDGAHIEVKGIDCDFSPGSFAVFREAFVAVCAHEEGAARYADHAFE